MYIYESIHGQAPRYDGKFLMINGMGLRRETKRWKEGRFIYHMNGKKEVKKVKWRSKVFLTTASKIIQKKN